MCSRDVRALGIFQGLFPDMSVLLFFFSYKEQGSRGRLWEGGWQWVQGGGSRSLRMVHKEGQARSLHLKGCSIVAHLFFSRCPINRANHCWALGKAWANMWSSDLQYQHHLECVRDAGSWAPPQVSWLRNTGGGIQESALVILQVIKSQRTTGLDITSNLKV